MAEYREMSQTNMMAILIALLAGVGLLAGWYFFPTW